MSGAGGGGVPAEPRWVVDFTTIAPGASSGAALAALAPDLDITFSRASAAMGTRTGLYTFTTAGGVDVPMIGQFGATAATRGLVVQEPSTNLVSDNRDPSGANWVNPGGTVSNAIAGTLDGEGLDTGVVKRVESPSGVNGPYHLVPALGFTSRGTFQWWTRMTPGAVAPVQSHLVGNWKATGQTEFIHGQIVDLTADWQCFTQIEDGGSVSAAILAQTGVDNSAYGGLAAGARDFLVDMIAVWPKGFPMQPQVQGAVLAERKPDRVSFDLDAVLVAGRFGMLVTFIPGGASWEYVDDGTMTPKVLPIGYADANNKLMRGADGILTATIGGVSMALPMPLHWSYGHRPVSVFFELGGGPVNVWASVDGGAFYVIGQTEASHPAIGAGLRWYVLNNGADLQLTSYQQIWTFA